MFKGVLFLHVTYIYSGLFIFTVVYLYLQWFIYIYSGLFGHIEDSLFGCEIPITCLVRIHCM